MAPPRPARTVSIATLVGSSSLFGVMAFLSKLATRTYDGATVGAARFLVGLVATLAIVAAMPLVGARRPKPRRLGMLLSRGISGGAAVLCYFTALSRLPVGVATLLNNTAPVFAALFGRLFLAEPLGKRGLLALATTSIGALLVVLGQAPCAGDEGLRGILPHVESSTVPWLLLGLLSGALSGIAMTSVRRLRQGAHPESPLSIFFFFCAAGLLCTAPLARSLDTPTATEALLLGGVGVTSVVAQLLMNRALRWVPAAVASMLSQLAVVTAATLGVLVLHEPWTALSALGSAAIILGITLVTTGS
jgi:drug/metabolite transporter (DMT)-like permease